MLQICHGALNLNLIKYAKCLISPFTRFCLAHDQGHLHKKGAVTPPSSRSVNKIPWKNWKIVAWKRTSSNCREIALPPPKCWACLNLCRELAHTSRNFRLSMHSILPFFGNMFDFKLLVSGSGHKMGRNNLAISVTYSSCCALRKQKRFWGLHPIFY